MDLPEREKKMTVPLFCLWGSDGNVGRNWDVVKVWENLASDVRGRSVNGCGYFVPEEKPEITAAEISAHIERNK